MDPGPVLKILMFSRSMPGEAEIMLTSTGWMNNLTDVACCLRGLVGEPVARRRVMRPGRRYTSDPEKRRGVLEAYADGLMTSDRLHEIAIRTEQGSRFTEPPEIRVRMYRRKAVFDGQWPTPSSELLKFSRTSDEMTRGKVERATQIAVLTNTIKIRTCEVSKGRPH